MVELLTRSAYLLAGLLVLPALILVGFWLPAWLLPWWAALLAVVAVGGVRFAWRSVCQVQAISLAEQGSQLLATGQSEVAAAAAALAVERMGASSDAEVAGVVLPRTALVLERTGHAGPATGLWVRYGQWLSNRHRRQEAIEAFRNGIRLLDTIDESAACIGVRVQVANLLALEARFPEAADEFRAVVAGWGQLAGDVPPEYLDVVRLQMAEVLHRTGESDEAHAIIVSVPPEARARLPRELRRIADVLAMVDERRAAIREDRPRQPLAMPDVRPKVLSRLRRWWQPDTTAEFMAVWEQVTVAGAKGDYATAGRLLAKSEHMLRRVGGPAVDYLLDGMKAFEAADAKRWRDCLANLEAMRAGFLASLRGNTHPEGIATRMAYWGMLFDLGVEAAEECWKVDCNPETLLAGFDFADSAKCLVIHEGLRQAGQRAAAAPQDLWRPGRRDWRLLFPWDETNPPTGTAVATRELPSLAVPSKMPFTLPGATSGVVETAVPGRLSADDLLKLLPDDQTVVLAFFWAASDLLAVPLRRGADNQPAVVHTRGGFFRVAKCADELTAVDVPGFGPDGRPLTVAAAPAAPTPVQAHATPFERVTAAMRLDEILTFIEPDPVRLAAIHLVIVPDGPLYQLPLHAAGLAGGPRLFERVASVRYALSVRTLLYQLLGPPAGGDAMKGVFFACSDPDGRFLPGVAREAERVAAGTGAQHWWLHGDAGSADELATAANLRARHAAGNVLWLAGHGGPAETSGPPPRVEDAIRLSDGPLGLTRLIADGYDLRTVELVHLSCCLLGRLTVWDGAREVIGPNALLALAGARRVCSALWPLDDSAAVAFAAVWAAAVRARCFAGMPPGPHGFALAFKDALVAFRRNHGGEFGGEQYWAPYVLYGAG